MTITVSVNIPTDFELEEGEVKQWVRDVTRWSPKYYEVRTDTVDRPTIIISRPDGTEGTYSLSETGDWEPQD